MWRNFPGDEIFEPRSRHDAVLQTENDDQHEVDDGRSSAGARYSRVDRFEGKNAGPFMAQHQIEIVGDEAENINQYHPSREIDAGTEEKCKNVVAAVAPAGRFRRVCGVHRLLASVCRAVLAPTFARNGYRESNADGWNLFYARAKWPAARKRQRDHDRLDDAHRAYAGVNQQLQVSLTFLDRATLRETLQAINLHLRP